METLAEQFLPSDQAQQFAPHAKIGFGSKPGVESMVNSREGVNMLEHIWVELRAGDEWMEV